MNFNARKAGVLTKLCRFYNDIGFLMYLVNSQGSIFSRGICPKRSLGSTGTAIVASHTDAQLLDAL